MTARAFVLATDSCCDLPRKLIDELDVAVLEFPFTLDGEQHFDDLGVSMPPAEFYGRMRQGSAPTTAQVPMTTYLDTFRSAAEAGMPLLHMCFSSGLSGTYDAAVLARDTIVGEFPDADIRVLDTLSASVQQGFLVLEAARRRQRGLGIDELESWIVDNLQRVNAYFTIDSLEALRRGGRVHDWAAAAVTVLDVKPILRVNGRGELVVDRAVRGRKKSLRVLADIFEMRAVDSASNTVVVAHADAQGDAAALETLLRERVQIEQVLTFDVGPVIGSHTGPGMVAVLFWGPERES